LRILICAWSENCRIKLHHDSYPFASRRCTAQLSFRLHLTAPQARSGRVKILHHLLLEEQTAGDFRSLLALGCVARTQQIHAPIAAAWPLMPTCALASIEQIHLIPRVCRYTQRPPKASTDSTAQVQASDAAMPHVWPLMPPSACRQRHACAAPNACIQLSVTNWLHCKEITTL